MKDYMKDLILREKKGTLLYLLHTPWIVIPIISIALGLLGYIAFFFAAIYSFILASYLKIEWIIAANELLTEKIDFPHNLNEKKILKKLEFIKVVILTACLTTLPVFMVSLSNFQKRHAWMVIPAWLALLGMLVLVIYCWANLIQGRFYLGKLVRAVSTKTPYNPETDAKESEILSLSPIDLRKTLTKVHSLLKKP